MQVLELESRVEQLVAENRLLTEARAHAESNQSQRAASALAERDGQIDTLKRSLEQMQREVERLTQINEGLSTSTSTIAVQHHERVRQIEAQHAEAMRSLQTQHSEASRELEEFRSGGGPAYSLIEEKDAEIAQLRAQLEATNARIREMQEQILAANGAGDADFLSIKDVDHFDTRCQQLCSTCSSGCSASASSATCALAEKSQRSTTRKLSTGSTTLCWTALMSTPIFATACAVGIYS